jgi:hypothetical protein
MISPTSGIKLAGALRSPLKNCGRDNIGSAKLPRSSRFLPAVAIRYRAQGEYEYHGDTLRGAYTGARLAGIYRY